LKIKDGGIGFDYRLGMGVPDLWIKLLKEVKDENWNMWQIWGELSGRRAKEKYIGYAESHDQALVGDKTLMFRLCDSKMYTDMARSSQDATVARGMALHKMIRLITMSAAGEGYLNFMGNEFGHPEWIDFPREGNGFSYFYCRRQWHLADDPFLKYGELLAFDREMIALAKKHAVFSSAPQSLYIDQNAKVLVYQRGSLIFAFNFDPCRSYEQYFLRLPCDGRYKVVLSTDDEAFGGYGRISKKYVYNSFLHDNGNFGTLIYLPSRTALCLKRIGKANERKD